MHHLNDIKDQLEGYYGKWDRGISWENRADVCHEKRDWMCIRSYRPEIIMVKGTRGVSWEKGPEVCHGKRHQRCIMGKGTICILWEKGPDVYHGKMHQRCIMAKGTRGVSC